MESRRFPDAAGDGGIGIPPYLLTPCHEGRNYRRNGEQQHKEHADQAGIKHATTDAGKTEITSVNHLASDLAQDI